MPKLGVGYVHWDDRLYTNWADNPHSIRPKIILNPFFLVSCQHIEMPNRKHIVITVPAAGTILAELSRGGSYEMPRHGDIEVIEVGRRKRVPVTWLEDKTGVAPGGLDHVIDAWLEGKVRNN